MSHTEDRLTQGDIFWFDFDSPSGSEPGYRRPVVIIQNNAVNRSRIGTAIVCPLTSNVRRAAVPGNVLLPAGEGNLPKASVANVTQILTIDRRSIGDWIGRLSSRRIREILNGIYNVLEPIEDDYAE